MASSLLRAAPVQPAAAFSPVARRRLVSPSAPSSPKLPPAIGRGRCSMPVAARSMGAQGAQWAYPDPNSEGWALGKRAPKKAEFALVPANDTVSDASLQFVEVCHWLLLLAPMFLSYVAFQAGVAAGTATAAASYCMVVFPVVQAISATAPMALHEYEGWQIAPISDAIGTSPATAGNQWLRQVSLRYLLSFQAVGVMLFNMGTFGWGGTLSLAYAAFCAASVLGIVLGPKNAWPVQMPWAPTAGPKSVPIPFPALWFVVVFLAHSIVNVVAYAIRLGAYAPPAPAEFFSAANVCALVKVLATWGVAAAACAAAVFFAAHKGSYNYKHGWLRVGLYGYALPILLVAAPFLPGVWGGSSAAAVASQLFWVPSVMVLLGGFIEAAFAETVWDQWMHATAVVWLALGFIAAALWLYPAQSAAAWGSAVRCLLLV